jgi:hypothetical protein
VSLWELLFGIAKSKTAIDDQRIQKRSLREGYPLNAEQSARLDELIRAGKRDPAVAAHREMSGSADGGARIAVDRRAAELGVRLA